MTPNPVHPVVEPAATAGSEVTDSILQNVQIQPSNPSGLRMPSPSLRYFDQPKSSASQSIQSLKIQSSNLRESGIPNPRKLSQSNHTGELKSSHALADTVRLTKGSTDKSAVGVKALSSTLRCLLQPAVTNGSHPPLKPQIEPKDLPVEAKASDSMSFSNQTNSQQNSHEGHVDVEESGGKQEDVKSQAHNLVGLILHDLNQGLELKDNSLPLHTGSPAQFQKDTRLEKQEVTRNDAQVEVEQILDVMNKGLDLKDDTLTLHTGSPRLFKSIIHLENQEDARNHSHDEVEQILHGVNQRLELNNNSLLLHTGSPKQFKKDIHLENQEDVSNHSHDEVEQILHDVNQGLELNDCSLSLRTGSPEESKTDILLEKQEDARNHAHDEAEQVLHDVNQGLELNENPLTVCTGSLEQCQKDNHFEKQQDARNDSHDEAEQISFGLNQGLEFIDNSLPLSTESPEQLKKAIHLEMQEYASSRAPDEDEQVLRDVNRGLEWNDNQGLDFIDNSLPLSTESPENLKKAIHLDMQEDTSSRAQDEDKQVLRDVNQGLERNDNEGFEFIDNSLPLSTESPEQLKKAIHLEMQEDASSRAQDEDKQVLRDVNQGLERNDNQGLEFIDNSLPLSTEFPENLKKAIHLDMQEGASSRAQDEDKQVLHDVNQGLERNDNQGFEFIDNSLPLSTESPENLKKAIHLDMQENASSRAQDEDEQVLCDVNHNPLFVCAGSPEQFQKDNHLENIVDANLINKNFSGSESGGYVHVPLSLNSQMQGESVIGAHMVDHSCVEKAQLESLYTDMPIDAQDIIPDMLLGDDIADSGANTSMVHVECVIVAHSGHTEQPAELMNPSTCELEQIDHMENHKILVPGSVLVEQSGPSEESQEDNDLGNISLSSEIGCQIETSDVQSPVGYMRQLKEGSSRIDAMKEVLQAEDSQFEPLKNPSSSPVSISGIVFKATTNEDNPNCCSRTGEGVTEQAEEQQNVGNPCPNEFEIDLQESVYTLEMNGSSLFLQSTSSEALHKDSTPILQSRSFKEPLKSNDLENIIYEDMESTYPSGNPCESSHILCQLEPMMQVKEGDDEDDTKIKHPRVEDASLEYLETNSLVENYESLFDSSKRNTLEHGAQGTLGSESSFKLGEDQTAGAVAAYDLEAPSCSNEKLPPSVQTTCRNSPHGIENNESQNNPSPEKTKTNPTETSGIPDLELQSESEDGEFYMKSESATVPTKRKSPEVSTQDALTIKYKLNAVPFSDEWLAALEAAGEDILTLKTGAVQNSPPDKSAPEPSPWSPVKRKHHDIGPFDCTKCTNLTPPNLP